MRFVLAMLVFLAVDCQGQQDEESRTALLLRVIGTMRHALARMPDYTCNEFITRTIGDGAPLRVRTRERVRLQVGLIGGQELFSWPGAGAFERDDPRDIVGGGLTGTGDFAGFSRAVFGSDDVLFTAGEEEVRENKRTMRYDYSVPREISGYVLHSGVDRAVVDYGGSLWVDLVTERVVALKVEADYRRHKIPEVLDMFDVKTVIDFKDIRVAGEELPFPAASTLTVVHLRTSIVTSNHVEFTECRQYSAESSIQFGERSTVFSIAPPAPPLAALPDGVDFEVELDEPILAASSAAGDAVSATLHRTLKAGTLQVPKGARLVGRILLVETDLEKNTTHVRLGFSHLEIEGRYLPFRARFVTSGPAKGVLEGAPQDKWVTLRDIRKSRAPEWAASTNFTLPGSSGQIKKGFRMRWTTGATRDSRR